MNDFPYVAPPEAGLRQALADARRRRFRTAGFSTSGIAAAVVVLVAVAGGQGTQSLVEQPAPQQPAVSHLVPDRGTAARTAPRLNQVSAGQVAGLSPHTSTTTAHHGSTSTPRHRRAASAGPRYVAGPIDRQDNTSSIPTPCLNNGTPTTSALCPWTNLAGDGSKDNPFVFQQEICSNRTSLTLLHYAGANEVDFVVSRVPDKGQVTPVWRWSSTNPDSPSPHTLGLQAASCTDWYFTWTQVTSSGARLGPGTYQLSATFLADELKGLVAGPVSFTIG